MKGALKNFRQQMYHYEKMIKPWKDERAAAKIFIDFVILNSYLIW